MPTCHYRSHRKCCLRCFVPVPCRAVPYCSYAHVTLAPKARAKIEEMDANFDGFVSWEEFPDDKARPYSDCIAIATVRRRKYRGGVVGLACLLVGASVLAGFWPQCWCWCDIGAPLPDAGG